MSREINRAIVHCSATRPQDDIDAAEIHELHTAPVGTKIEFGGRLLSGKGWSAGGYHYIVKRDGSIEIGREHERQGAHSRGQNGDSLGIVMVGGVNDHYEPDSNYTRLQWMALDNLMNQLDREYPGLQWFGHRDFSNKACPCFDAHAFRNEDKP